jgi:hypothetical protein
MNFAMKKISLRSTFHLSRAPEIDLQNQCITQYNSENPAEVVSNLQTEHHEQLSIWYARRGVFDVLALQIA